MRRSEFISPWVNVCVQWVLSQDAVLAAEAGVDAILLSNHGGKPILTRTSGAFRW